MAAAVSASIWVGLVRSLRWLLALESGPANLAEEVADRLFDRLTPDERALLRLRFGVDPETNATLEEIFHTAGLPRRRQRTLEGEVLVALFRWENRQRLLSKVHQRLMQRIASAHVGILECLCDAPAVRHVLVSWHDRLVDGRCLADKIGKPPDRSIGSDPDAQRPSPEIMLAAMIRRALWANTRVRKAIWRPDDKPCSRSEKMAKALDAFGALRLNSHAIRELAEALLAPARRIEPGRDEPVPPVLDPIPNPEATRPKLPPNLLPHWHGELPDFSSLDPELADAVTEQAGIPLADLWTRAARIHRLLVKARRNRQMLVDSCMPLVAEVAVEKGLRNRAFLDAIESGRSAIQRLAEGFIHEEEQDFAAAATRIARAAIDQVAPAENGAPGV